MKIQDIAKRYPEHEKLDKVREKSQSIGEFLEWLDQRGIVSAKWSDGGVTLIPQYNSIERMLAEYFGIDLKEIENEKRQILEDIRIGVYDSE